MIISIRGPSGAGKSTLVRRVMGLGFTRPVFKPGRTRPEGYYIVTDNPPMTVAIPGSYENVCGGCDTLPNLQTVDDIVRVNANLGNHVLYEGLMPGEDVTRAVALHRDYPGEFMVIELTTPIDECIERVKARRAARGNDKPLNETNTRNRAKGYARRRARRRAAGVIVKELDCEQAFQTIKLLFGLGLGPVHVHVVDDADASA